MKKMVLILIVLVILVLAFSFCFVSSSTPKTFDLTGDQFACLVEKAILSNDCSAAYSIFMYYKYTRSDREAARRWWRIGRMIETNQFLESIGTNSIEAGVPFSEWRGSYDKWPRCSDKFDWRGRIYF